MGIRSQSETALLTIANVTCRIGRRRALQIGAFALYPGQQWCIFGGNGAGKTLFGRLLGGRLPVADGEIVRAPDFDPHLQLVEVSFEEQQRLWEFDDRHDISEFQADAVDAGTTVRSLILGSENPDPVRQTRYRELVATLALQEVQEQGIRFLSSGQVRRAMLARALMGKADGRFRLLILDDPLESIDRESREPVRQLLARWMDDRSCVVQLCRRAGDILPGITHLALMQDLVLREQGELARVKAGRLFHQLTDIIPTVPVKLPESPMQHARLSADTNLIELRQVTASYANQIVLNRISWTMRSGQHTLIEGPNGCGKSTLLSLIDGENHKAYGQDVHLFGRRRGSGESVWDIKARFGVVSNELHNRYIRGWRVLEV
ncbi:MAG: ATP-binding cassette domain-containing protein, partial [Pseudohongiellaceae bacterium]